MHNVVSKKYNIKIKKKEIWYLIKEFSKIKNNLLLIDKDGYKINNYIIGEVDIKEDNQNVRIINSYEQSNRESSFIEYFKYEKSYENEKEIKENCEIRINYSNFLIIFFNIKFSNYIIINGISFIVN